MLFQDELFICARTRNAIQILFKSVGFAYNCHNRSLEYVHICSIDQEMCYFKKKKKGIIKDQYSLLLYWLNLVFFINSLAMFFFLDQQLCRICHSCIETVHTGEMMAFVACLDPNPNHNSLHLWLSSVWSKCGRYYQNAVEKVQQNMWCWAHIRDLYSFVV